MLMQEVVCFQSMQSRLGEAWARPRRGRKMDWHKDKARLMGTRNCIILLLKSQQGWTWSSWCLCCLARILIRSWRKGTASRQASRLQGCGNCSKPKKNTGWNKVGGRPQCKSWTPVSRFDFKRGHFLSLFEIRFFCFSSCGRSRSKARSWQWEKQQKSVQKNVSLKVQF